MSELIVTVDDLYSVPNYSGRPGFCGRGARAFFARHDLDWLTFVREGLPARVFLETGDAMARRLVEHAERSHG